MHLTAGKNNGVRKYNPTGMSRTIPPLLKETDDFIVVDKPAGLLSIPDREGNEMSLKKLLQEKYGEIYTVHRIDRDTSGVILFAKTEDAHKHFSQAFEDRSVEKYYLGIVKDVWLEEADFQKYAGKSAPISWLGFHIIDKNEDLGEILEVIEQPHQVLCRIMLEGREALIPVHQDTLKKIDKKNRRVMLDLPDGLLEIFR